MIEDSKGSWHETRGEDHFWLRRFSAVNEVIIATNRQPYADERAADGTVVTRRSTSGVVTAVEPLARSCAAVWIAHGSGTADRETTRDRDGLLVSPQNPEYRLRRVWLEPDEYRGYYDGFANEGLWPLCHKAGVSPVFRPRDFAAYARVNARFAQAVVDEAAHVSPIVLLQDYHLALAPLTIRPELPLSTLVSFWHVPWPPPHELARCPWDGLLLRALLESDIVGFQTRADCDAFLDGAERRLGARVDRAARAITWDRRRVLVRAYPVSVEWPNRWASSARPVDACRSAVRAQLRMRPDVRIAVGVDRLDYTKGLEHKFLAVERLLERCPALRERLTLVQLAEPSRGSLSAYRHLRCRLEQAALRINQRFGTATYRPIELIEGHHSPETVFRFLRAADICYVGSLHDGMNLVSKEFVCARDDEQGVLVLSARAGAADELVDALIVDPFDVGDSANALAEALAMGHDEQRARMRRLRAVVASANARHWGARLLGDVARLRPERRRTARRPTSLLRSASPGLPHHVKTP
jgi:trehalose 6-phosphate synthase